MARNLRFPTGLPARDSFARLGVIALVVVSVCGTGTFLLTRSDASEVPPTSAPLFHRAGWVSTPVLDPTTTTTTTTRTTAAPQTTATVAVTTTMVPKYAAGNSGAFALAPNAKLPSGKECAKQVKKTRECRPANAVANHTTPKSKPSLLGSWGSDPATAGYLRRIDGNFTGTTDEILQWASCKWGLDVDATRAQAMVESGWRQAATAASSDDASRCVGGMQPPCPLAFGLMQLRADYHPATYPNSSSSTAYNVDYALGMKRACYDGHLWVGAQSLGNAWGCAGVHYSGSWLDDAAKAYITKVQLQYVERPWLRW